MKLSKKNIILVVAILLLIGLSGFLYEYKKRSDLKKIDNFEKCKDAGYPIMESFPEQCKTPDGRNFVKAFEPQAITVSGEVVCLPHRIKEGPQTLECAFGLKDGNGNHYGLSDPEFKFISNIPTGAKVTVNGKFKNDNDIKYDTLGIIEIESISRN